MTKRGWDYRTLGEVCETTAGGTPSRSHPEYYENGNIPWVRSGELSKHIVKTEICITEEGLRNSSAKMLPCNTVLVAMYGATVGAVGILDIESCTNQAVCAILPHANIDTNYLYYFFVSQKQRLIAAAKGGAQPNISQQTIKEISIPIPSLDVQSRIVEELEGISGLIAKERAALADYDRLARSLFFESFGDPVGNDRHWPVKRLGEVCEAITDGDHMPPPKADAGIPFITISDIDKTTRKINFGKTFFVPHSYYDNLKNSRKAKKGDLLYTVTGSYGIPVIVNRDKPFCFQRHIALLRPDKNKLETLFLCYWSLCDSVKYMADREAKGIAQKTVGLNSIRNFPIILPSLAQQQAFAEKIEKIEQLRARTEAQIHDLETLLEARMQHWFD